MSLCNREASVVRLSVRLSVNFVQIATSTQKWLDRYQTCTRWSPQEPASRLCSRSRSKVTWYGHFCDFTEIASSHSQMAGSPPNVHMMVPRRARIQDALKVKVKRHVIQTLFWLHENRFFYHKHDWIATKLAHDGPHMGLQSGCAQGQGQGQRSRDTDTFVISRKSLLLPQTWLDRHQTCTRWSPYGPASRMCSRSRSKVTWYGHFSDYTKIASSTTNMTGSLSNLHNMVPTQACIQDVLKVKVKDHVIRALLWCHKMFAIQYLLTFCLYMHALYEAPLHSPSSTSVRQLDVTST